MSILTKHNDVEFGVGDTIKVTQGITEGDKKRSQVFEGIVIYIKGKEENTSFCVRRIGSAQIGIERIFPLHSPSLESVKLVRSGHRGVRSANLKYIRDKSKREIEKIYTRAVRREEAKKVASAKKVVKRAKKVRKSSAK